MSTNISTKPARQLRLLSLDGGGVRGLSSLLILKQLMRSINTSQPPKPCEVFDLIGGTSTGGLIAIMLGRLEMDIDACINSYLELSSSIFQKKSTSFVGRLREVYSARGRFDSRTLEEAVKKIVISRGLSADATLSFGEEPKCKTFVCAIRKESRSLVRFRTYSSSRATDVNPKIWEAARATSAATSFFDPVSIGQYGQEFVDGATGFNNPVECVLDEAQDLWEDAVERIQYIISVGTGEPYVNAFGNNLVDIGKTLIRISTDAEETARRFSRSHRGRFTGVNGEPYRYQRFNVTKGLENIKLEEAEKIKEIASATERYMELDEQFSRIRKFGADVRSAQAQDSSTKQVDTDEIHVVIKGNGVVPDQDIYLPAKTSIRSIWHEYFRDLALGVRHAGWKDEIPWSSKTTVATITDQSSSYDPGNLKLNQDSPIVPFFKTFCYPANPPQVEARNLGNSTTIAVEKSLKIALFRTIRIDQSRDDKLFELPAGFGAFPLFSVEDFKDTVPNHMIEKGGLILPMYENEAMFLAFEPVRGRYAIRPFLGGVNAISGESLVPNMTTVLKRLNKIERKQDYVVVQKSGPTQKRLDGAATGRGVVRQFVAVAPESNKSVEHQITGANHVGCLQLEIIPQFEYLDRFCISLSDCSSEDRQGTYSRNFEELFPATSHPCTTPRKLGLKPGDQVYAHWRRPKYSMGEDDRNFEEVENEICWRDRTLLDEWIALDPQNRAHSVQSSLEERKLILSPFRRIKDKLHVVFESTTMKTTVALDRRWTVSTFGHRVLEHMNLENRLDRYRFQDHYDKISGLYDPGLIEVHDEQRGGGGDSDYVELTFGAGAKIRQNIVMDTVEPWRWDTRRARLLNIHIVNSQQFRTLTGGLQPPPSPISFQTYFQLGTPLLAAPDENEDVLAGCLDMIRPVPGAADLTEFTGAANDLQNQEDEKLGEKRKRKWNDDERFKNPWFCHLCKEIFSSAYR